MSPCRTVAVVGTAEECAILLRVLSTVRVLAHNGPVRIELARWNGRLVVTKRVLGVSAQLAERLEREAAVAGRLKHRNIVSLLAVHDDTLVYDYCPGINLADLIDDVRLKTARILEIMDCVLAALEFAHAQGVIHLDVKPSNILIRGRLAMLTDFGFAKDLALANITGEHSLLGTPGYMAPEQFRGVRNDPRSDVFSAAAVFYHMLAGRPPYGRDALRFLAGDDSLQLRQLEGGLAVWNPVLQTALERDPARRIQSAADLRGALRSVQVPTGITA